MSTPETSSISSQIARWENMRKLVETWQPPYHWSSVDEFTSRIAEIEQDLDGRHPGWHEPWAHDLSRISDWLASVRAPETPRIWTHRLGDANGGEVLDRYVYLALGVFGSISPADDDRKALAEHLSTETARWINEHFGLSLKVDRPVDVERERLLDLIENLLVTIKTSTVHGSLVFYDRAKAALREYGRLGKES